MLTTLPIVVPQNVHVGKLKSGGALSDKWASIVGAPPGLVPMAPLRRSSQLRLYPFGLRAGRLCLASVLTQVPARP